MEWGIKIVKISMAIVLDTHIYFKLDHSSMNHIDQWKQLKLVDQGQVNGLIKHVFFSCLIFTPNCQENTLVLSSRYIYNFLLIMSLPLWLQAPSHDSSCGPVHYHLHWFSTFTLSHIVSFPYSIKRVLLKSHAIAPLTTLPYLLSSFCIKMRP